MFVEEYLIDMNATRAYKVAYPNIKSDEVAAQSGSRLLRNDKVKAKIAERMRDREARTEITQDMVVKELAAIAFANGSDFARVVTKKGKDKEGKEVEYQDVELELTDNLSADKKKAIASIKQGRNGIEVSTCDKVKALELLGRHLGMFKDKVELDANVGVEIIDDIQQ